MRITPRKQEVDEVEALLEGDDFDNSKDAAKALFKLVGNRLAMRDMWACVHTWADGTRGLNYGPFGTEGDAQRFGERLGGVGGTVQIVPIYSPEALIANQDGKKSQSPWCLDEGCGHAPFAHSMAGTSRGACQIPGCPCGQYRK
jgi:hypothetical protein